MSEQTIRRPPPSNKNFLRKKTYDTSLQFSSKDNNNSNDTNQLAPRRFNQFQRVSSYNNPKQGANPQQLQFVFDQYLQQRHKNTLLNINNNQTLTNINISSNSNSKEPSLTNITIEEQANNLFPEQNDEGLKQLMSFNPDKSPPDLLKAYKHGKAQRVCKEIDYSSYRGERCECCGKAVVNQLLSMSDHPNEMKHIGTCYPLYFMFSKQCFIFMLIHFLVQAIPALYIYSQGDFCEKIENSTFICSLSFLNILNQKQNTEENIKKTQILAICNFASILIQLISIQVFKIYQKHRYAKVDNVRNSVSYYSIIVKNFPSTVALEQLEDMLEQNVKGAKKDIVRMFLLYDLHSYAENKKQRDKIVRQINQINMKINQLQDNQQMSQSQIQYKQEQLEMELGGLQSEKDQIESELMEITQLLNDQAKSNLENLRGISIDSNYRDSHMKFNMKFSGKIIVTFKTHEIQTKVTKFFKKNLGERLFENFSLFFKICQRCIYRKFYILNQRISVKQAPEPSDILWTEIVSVKNKTINRIKSDIMVAFCIILDLVVLLYFKVKIYNAKINETTFMTLFLNLCSASLVACGNVIIGIIIRRYAKKEERTTQTSYFVQVGRKLTKMFMVNMLLTIFLGNIIFWYSLGFYDKPGDYDRYNVTPLVQNLIGEYFFLFITNSYISSLMSIFDIMWIRRLIRRCCMKRQIKNQTCYKTQSDANSLFEGHPIDMALRYANILKVVLYSCAISAMLPIGVPMCLVGVFIIYWADKYLLYRRMVCNNYISNNLQKKMMKLMHLSTVFFAIGNCLTSYLPYFDHFNTSLSSKLESKGHLQLAFGGLILALTFQYIPFRKVSVYYLYKKFTPHKNQLTRLRSQDFYAVKDKIYDDYDLYHPASRDDVLRNDLLKQEEKIKKQEQFYIDQQRIMEEDDENKTERDSLQPSNTNNKSNNNNNGSAYKNQNSPLLLKENQNDSQFTQLDINLSQHNLNQNNNNNHEEFAEKNQVIELNDIGASNGNGGNDKKKRRKNKKRLVNEENENL